LSILTYSSHEDKKPVHILNLDSFSKESQERNRGESIVIIPSVFFSSESLELFVMVHQVTPSDVISLAVFDVRPPKKPIYLFFIVRSYT